MTIRDTFNSSVSSNHASAETGGISGLPGAAAPGNATTWSRVTAKAALASGALTAAQYVDAMQRISGWEQAQNSLAKATLRNGGDYFPV